MVLTMAGQAENPLTFASTTSPTLTSGAAVAAVGGVLDIVRKRLKVVEGQL